MLFIQFRLSTGLYAETGVKGDRRMKVLYDLACKKKEHFFCLTRQGILEDEDWENKLEAYEFGYLRGKGADYEETIYYLNHPGIMEFA